MGLGVNFNKSMNVKFPMKRFLPIFIITFCNAQMTLTYDGLVRESLDSDSIRYLDEVFENVTITEDVVYGNAPDLPFIFLFEWNTYDLDLDMDIYEPEGDTETQRPVIIFIHAGAFFSGHNELDDVVALSIAAAKRGYVAVSINYRLGLNILSAYSGERAVYRGVQDASAAVRYLKEFSSEYNIDENNIFVWGTSAGSFIGLHLAYSEDDERPESTYGGWGDPDLGCIDCEGNSYDHDSRPKALVSCWGAIGDLDWIDPENDVPSILFHGTADPIVPYNSGFPFTFNILLPIVYGSNLIQGRLSELGIENEFHGEEGQLHEYWGTVNGNWFDGPNEYFEQIQSDAFLFLYNQLYSVEVPIDHEVIPKSFTLHQNYPNPFNPITTLRYDLPEQSHVTIVIYDMLGRTVKQLINTTQDAGFKSVIWNATNDYGKPVSAGVYLYQIQAGEFVQTRKMVLLK
ncbi:MAG TPA: T9SS type A sorting domain-containing protein [Candidatus Marinimicrobia bacterium]|nr:T9SS type A sorting domain-containing protein [Candidatus Neomarinimicrobiota bacterium]